MSEGAGTTWALALHGGAGVIHKTLDAERREEYEQELARALNVGIRVLRGSGTALDAVEEVVKALEDCPLFNAGRGSVFTHSGSIELEASIMDGRTLRIGAVAQLTTIKNPVSLARKLLEKHIFTETTFLAGDAAEKYADSQPSIQRVPPTLLLNPEAVAQLARDSASADEDRAPISPQPLMFTRDPDVVDSRDLEELADRLKQVAAAQSEGQEQMNSVPGRSVGTLTWAAQAELIDQGAQATVAFGDACTSMGETMAPRREKATGTDPAFETGTVGCVALDAYGNIAAATSTGGRTNKMAGRIGDTPIIGAGTFAKNGTCAVSGTGKGEEFQRHLVAHSISAAIEYGRMSLQEAAEHVVFKILQPGDGGVIALDIHGNIVMPFNSVGMFRAAADSQGRHEVAIWD